MRALTPHVGAYLQISTAASGSGCRSARADEGASRLDPGRLEVSDGRLLLGCGDGVLRSRSCSPPGARPMPIDAYLRGHRPPSRAATT